MTKNYSGKTVLIIGGGLLQIPAIKSAKELGLFTIVADLDPVAEGMKLADYPLIISTRNADGIASFAAEFSKKKTIDAVFTAGTDVSVTVAKTQAALGLPGIKYEDALAASDKSLMRRRFADYHVNQPGFVSIKNYNEIEKACSRLSFPLVIKPADNMGARGVKKIFSIIEAREAYNTTVQFSASKTVIIEEFMDGPELSIDALVYNGEIFITGIGDRIIENPPYFIETGHIMPSALPPDQISAGCEVFKQGIKALGITIGAAKGDIKITPQGAMVGEIAARLSGGFMSGFTYPYATGVNLTANALAIALGYPPPDLEEKFSRVSAEKAIIARPGKIFSINGLEDAQKISGCKNIFLKYKTGDLVKAPTSNVEKGGNVIVVGETRTEALSIADHVLSTIKIITV
ncbi:MAG TPA: hypothetical protein DC049_03520 [Spirochaetia bacterium]|nr:hypothetical protein [Spirochaetia bacterium]